MSDEDRWELEYEEFEKTPFFQGFRQIIETIYEYNGVIVEDFGGVPHADAQSLAIADTRELISYSQNSNNVIELSRKGKAFARMYLSKYRLLPRSVRHNPV